MLIALVRQWAKYSHVHQSSMIWQHHQTCFHIYIFGKQIKMINITSNKLILLNGQLMHWLINPCTKQCCTNERILIKMIICQFWKLNWKYVKCVGQNLDGRRPLWKLLTHQPSPSATTPTPPPPPLPNNWEWQLHNLMLIYGSNLIYSQINIYSYNTLVS